MNKFYREYHASPAIAGLAQEGIPHPGPCIARHSQSGGERDPGSHTPDPGSRISHPGSRIPNPDK